MFVFTVCFERKCDFVQFLVPRKISGICGMSERCSGEKSVVEIYSETDIKGIMAEALADYILGPFLNGIALSLMDSEYPFISTEEKKIVLSKLKFKKYEPDVKTEVYNYLVDNDYMDIPGFVRFRLPGFSRDITVCVAKECEDMLTHREYEGMVALLKHHVSCSRSFGTIRIIFHQDGGFCMVHPDGKEMDIAGSEESVLDGILGMLMISVPEKIEIYNRQYAKNGILTAIDTVFGDAVKYCE